jgi:hypothetical protein
MLAIGSAVGSLLYEKHEEKRLSAENPSITAVSHQEFCATTTRAGSWKVATMVGDIRVTELHNKLAKIAA